MKQSVDLKRRALLKVGGAVAVLPVAGCGGESNPSSQAPAASAATEPVTGPAATPAVSTPPAALKPDVSPVIPEISALRFKYDQPAVEANILFEGLPVGNGRLGALTGGASTLEALYLNDITLWSGQKNIVDQSYSTTGLGTYLSLGKLYIAFPDHANATNYTRSLDISNSVVRTQYTVGTTTYNREIFSSYPDNVIVARFTSSSGGTHSGTVSLFDGQGKTTAGESNQALSFSGSVPGSGELYAACAMVIPDSGSITFNSTNSQLSISNCSAFTVILAARTDYSGKYTDNYLTGMNPLCSALAEASTAAAKTYQDLLWHHVSDYQSLFSRMELNLGKSTDAQNAMTIPARLQARTASPSVADPELEALYVQFGRYLTISSSRGSLPANLQGLWNTTNSPPWMADYHTDINVQMNYWLADRAGLPECQQPFADFIVNQLPGWTDNTQKHFNDASNSSYRNSSGKIAGWTTAITTGIYGSFGWDWHPGGSAWLCRTLWNHYEFTLDKAYLEKIYPAMKSACEFWQARLIKDPVSGLLIDDNDWSPENGDRMKHGITYAQELVWDLFTNYISASTLLGKDATFSATIAGLKSQLYLPKISPTTGQLQEWMEDIQGEPQHRHLSPLIGWFEGERIDLTSDPALVTAVKKLLIARGTESYGWGLAWRTACWARFGDATTAYTMVQKLLRFSRGNDGVNGTFSNMFDAYAGNLFQIDANFGGPSAILEMLLQSNMNRITLLPALPKEWANGSVKGLRAKGGLSVDMSWSNGTLVSATISSVGGAQTTVQHGANSNKLIVPSNGSVKVNGKLALI